MPTKPTIVSVEGTKITVGSLSPDTTHVSFTVNNPKGTLLWVGNVKRTDMSKDHMVVDALDLPIQSKNPTIDFIAGEANEVAVMAFDETKDATFQATEARSDNEFTKLTLDTPTVVNIAARASAGNANAEKERLERERREREEQNRKNAEAAEKARKEAEERRRLADEKARKEAEEKRLRREREETEERTRREAEEKARKEKREREEAEKAKRDADKKREREERDAERKREREELEERRRETHATSHESRSDDSKSSQMFWIAVIFLGIILAFGAAMFFYVATPHNAAIPYNPNAPANQPAPTFPKKVELEIKWGKRTSAVDANSGSNKVTPADDVLMSPDPGAYSGRKPVLVKASTKSDKDGNVQKVWGPEVGPPPSWYYQQTPAPAQVVVVSAPAQQTTIVRDSGYEYGTVNYHQGWSWGVNLGFGNGYGRERGFNRDHERYIRQVEHPAPATRLPPAHVTPPPVRTAPLPDPRSGGYYKNPGFTYPPKR